VAGPGGGALIVQQATSGDDSVVFKTLGCSVECATKFGCIATPEFMLGAFTFGFLLWCEAVRKKLHGNEDHKAPLTPTPTAL